MRSGELIAGRYELIERLGRGGMGEVWTCRDRELRRDVAVKFLALDDSVPADVPQRFEREAIAAAQINHPNVVALHDRGVDKDCLFLVMERVNGTTLAAQVRESGPLPPGRALEIGQQICAALVAAHTASVIHYDIKPLNVMLTRDGRVKVVDFGIAGFVQTTFTASRSADLPVAGTPEYGAPEQFGTERGDERSDLYALGGVLFTLLTGQPPYTGPNGFAVVRRKLAEDAPSVASLRPDIPPAIAHLVEDLLRREPDERPQKAAEVLDRLTRLRAALDILDLSNSPTVVSHTVVDRGSSADEGFELSWPGRDRFSGRAPRFALALWSWWSLVALFLILGYVFRNTLGDGDWTLGDMVEFLVSAQALGAQVTLVGGGIALIFALGTMASAMSYARRISKAQSWSLRVGPNGITTTDATSTTASTGPSGRRTFGWNHVEMVTLEEIRSKTLKRDSGLHIRFTPDAPYNGRIQPAGWNQSYSPTVRADGSIPLCVLGPLTEQQHAALVTALARHAGHRWHPEIGYLDGSVT